MVSGSRDAGRSRSLQVEYYIGGYHMYQRIWNPFVGEVAIAVITIGYFHITVCPS